VSSGAGVDSRWWRAQLRSSEDVATRAGGGSTRGDDGRSGLGRRLYVCVRASQPRLDGSQRVGDPHGQFRRQLRRFLAPGMSTLGVDGSKRIGDPHSQFRRQLRRFLAPGLSTLGAMSALSSDGFGHAGSLRRVHNVVEGCLVRGGRRGSPLRRGNRLGGRTRSRSSGRARRVEAMSEIVVQQAWRLGRRCGWCREDAVRHGQLSGTCRRGAVAKGAEVEGAMIVVEDEIVLRGRRQGHGHGCLSMGKAETEGAPVNTA
jgi:hypothetical protein